MATYETKDDLKAAVEKRLKRPLTTEEWLSAVPEYSAPYDDTSLKEVLAAQRLRRDDTKFIEETQRLGQFISRELEAAHRINEGTRQILTASGLNLHRWVSSGHGRGWGPTKTRGESSRYASTTPISVAIRY